MMKGILTRLRIGLGLSLFAGALAWGVILVLLGVKPRRVKASIAGILAGPILRVTRIHLTVTGKEILLGTRPAVVVGNQQSVLCYCIYARLLREAPDSGIVARLTEGWDIPGLVWLFRHTRNYMVDLNNPMRTAVGYVDALRDLKEGQGRVWIGPEGTRWKEPGTLGPFRAGAFRLALEAQVPVVPIVISPLKPRTDLVARRLDDNPVEMRVLDPVPTEGMSKKDLGQLKQEVRNRMEEALGEMAQTSP